MSLSLNNLTFVIVTFKSEHIIHECINSLPKDSNIIVVENSMDEKFKNNLEKLPKLFCITKSFCALVTPMTNTNQ